MTDLASPLRLPCGVTLPNRLFKSAMTEGLADSADLPTKAHATLYRRWSDGGAGVLVTGNVMVDRRFLERPGNVVLDDRTDLSRFADWVREGTHAGNQLWVQLSHPGRQCTRMVTSEPVAPSEVPLRLGGLFARPRALTEDEILDVIARFGRAAGRVKSVGFTGVQIHGAHGYLASQFLSPRVNQRTDRWGGSLENRARFLLEAVRAARSTVGPGYPVSVKLNSSDFQKGAFSSEDSCQVAAWLAEEGIDLLEISGGTYEHLRLVGADDEKKLAELGLAERTQKREAYFLEYAKAIRAAAKVPLAVTGGFRKRATMLAALESGELDVIGLARPLCTQPDAPRGLLDGTLDELRADEHDLALGPGFLGPRTSSDTLRGLNAQAQTAWFYRQILRLSEDAPLELDATARSSLWTHVNRERRLAKARRAPG
ncbi:MAG TPA: NADH:flavin oxidoreductase/NADH oxidase family protein [Polyangiaceae bacterium]|nr:NADH:flavin oxidoreductase/NADH oxidase family protein [Polyangiaceae bacterium]